MAILKISQLGGSLANMWESIINWIAEFVPNYAWAIVLLTVAIKLLMSPLDFYNKKVSRKNASMQAVIQPQLEKIKAQYGHDPNLYNQKTNELYRANNYNVVGSCLFMLLNLSLTLVIFISLLNGMNQMASARITSQYANLKNTYEQTLVINQEKDKQEKVEAANQAVVKEYKQLKDSWLWIENVWKSDTVTNSIPSFDEYIKVARTIEFDGKQYETKNIKKELSEEQNLKLRKDYENVMKPLRENVGKANGYYILVVLVVGTSILSQWLSQRKLKAKNAGSEDPTQGMNKIMMLMMPVLFGIFALSSTSMFSLYLVTSQLMAIMLTPLVDLLIDRQQEKVQTIKQTKNAPEYSRDRVKQVFEPKEISSEPKEKSKSTKTNKGEKK